MRAKTLVWPFSLSRVRFLLHGTASCPLPLKPQIADHMTGKWLREGFERECNARSMALAYYTYKSTPQ